MPSNHPRTLTPIFIVSLFGLIYLSISLVNHYLFRTYALDLGLYNQAIYSLSRFRPAIYTLDITGIEMNFFATHWSPVVFLYIPFYYLFGSYTLLLIQICAILAGGYGLYLISLNRGLSIRLSQLILIFFYSLWGIYSALAFDFHNTVIAAMLLPWIFYYLDKGKRVNVVLLFIIFLSCQENMSLWMVFIIIGAFSLSRYRSGSNIKLFAILLMVSLAWFLIVSLCLMPSLLPEGVPGQLGRYSLLGDSMLEILKNLVLNPVDNLKLMFTNTTGEPVYDGIKLELFLVIIGSGGLALIARPQYLIMIIPIYLQKVFSSDYALWGINYHYSIEIAPILALALIDSISMIRKSNFRNYIAIGITLITILTSLSVIESRKSKWYNQANTSFYSRKHYHSAYSRKDILDGLSQVPAGAKVSVSSELAPRLDSCRKLYHFPVIKDAEFILVLVGSEVTFPISKEEYLTRINELKESSIYKIEFESDDLLVFKLI